MAHRRPLDATFSALLRGILGTLGTLGPLGVMVTGCGGGLNDVACHRLKTVDHDALIKAQADKYISPEECTELCDPEPVDPTGSTGSTGADGSGQMALNCRAVAGEDDQLRCGYNCDDCTCGRRPVGLRSQGRAQGADASALWLAEAAHLEAASVLAFEELAEALARLGAPEGLAARARKAANDERRHAARMTRLARRFGGEPALVERDPTAPRTLLELAIDNAVEGCVGEAWSALIARHQAQTATSAEVRAVLAGIADDELEHAELAWAIDDWLRARLSKVEMASVDALRVAAQESLRRILAAMPDDPTLDVLGLPRRSVALMLYDGMRREVWACAA